MRNLAVIALGAVVLVALAGGCSLAEDSGYQQSFLDPVEHPDYPDIDIISLASYVDGDVVVLVLTVNGTIVGDECHTYSINVGMMAYGGGGSYSSNCYYNDGVGICIAYIKQGEEVTPRTLEDSWSVLGSSLTFRLPVEYAGPEENFNISGSTSYYSNEDPYLSENDWVNFDEGYYQSGYDLADAIPLGVPGSASDTLDGMDRDIYSIELQEGMGLGVQLTADNPQTFYLTLLDSDGTCVSGMSYTMFNNSLSYIVQENGTYYVVVEYWGGTDGDMEYSLSTALRGQSGEGFELEEPGTVLWEVGAEWSAGGYMSMEELMVELYSTMDTEYYDNASFDWSGDGGVGDYLTIAYSGVDGDAYRFDYEGRIYADVSMEMSMSYSNLGGDEYPYGEDSDMETSADMTGIADLAYSGSIWLAHYGNGNGSGYYGMVRQTYAANGSLDCAMFSESKMSSDYYSYTYSMNIELNGTFGLELDISNSPGMPFLPEPGADISVEKKVTTTYTGSGHAHIETNMDTAGLGENSQEDSPYDFVGEMNGSYETYYTLDYDDATGEAHSPPAVTDPITYIQLLTRGDYESGYYGEPSPLTGDYWTAGATFDRETGFYTAFELPLSPLGSALNIEEGGESSPLSGLDLGDAGMSMSRVSLGEARRFIEDPEGFVSSRGTPTVPTWALFLAIGAACGSAATAAVVVLARRGNKPRKPGVSQEPPHFQSPPV